MSRFSFGISGRLGASLPLLNASIHRAQTFEKELFLHQIIHLNLSMPFKFINVPLPEMIVSCVGIFLLGMFYEAIKWLQNEINVALLQSQAARNDRS